MKKPQSWKTVKMVASGGSILPDVTKELLVDRGKTHGSFRANAECSQVLKGVIESFAKTDMGVDMLEALDMIALKISRIVTGDPNFKDHWEDIAGYARLIADRL